MTVPLTFFAGVIGVVAWMTGPASLSMSAVPLLAESASPSAEDGGHDNRGEVWSSLVRSAFKRADVVLLGTVTDVRSYVAVDGGHGYDVEVAEVFKGGAVEKVSFRAGGWAYTIKYSAGEKALLFLKESRAFLPNEKYVPVHDDDNRPVVFRVQGEEVVGLTGETRSKWGRHGLGEYLILLRGMASAK